MLGRRRRLWRGGRLGKPIKVWRLDLKRICDRDVADPRTKGTENRIVEPEGAQLRAEVIRDDE